MRRELKKMEKRMDREDERDLKQLEGRPKRHILRNVLLIALGTIAAALVAGYFLFDVPSWQRLDIQKITAVQQTGAIYDRNGELISALKGSEDRTLIALSSLPDHVKNAFIAAEDLRFYRHPGFDVVRIFGAVMANLRSRGFSEGASTSCRIYPPKKPSPARWRKSTWRCNWRPCTAKTKFCRCT